MKYVSHVKTSIKGGCDVQLSPRTVIVGPNGSGKTTIVQAIELAAVGWVSDMEGRDQVKQSKALSRLFEDHDNMFAELTVHDTEGNKDFIFEWSMEAGSRGSFKTPQHEPPLRVRFPVQDLMATLKGDSSTMGAWLEKQVLDSMTTEDLLSALPPAVRDDAEAFITSSRSSDFLALAKAAAAESKNLKTKATRTETTIDKMLEGIAPPLTEGKLAELEEQRAALSSRTSKGVEQREYDALERTIGRLEADIEKLKAKIPTLPQPPPAAAEALDKVNGAKHLIKAHLSVFGIDSCWVCGNDTPNAIAEQVDVLTGIETELRVHREAADTFKAANDLLAAYVEDLASKKTWLSGLHVSDGEEEAEARQLLDTIAQDKANRRAWENADAQRREVAQMRAQADRLSLVGKELKKAGERLLGQQKAAFEARVSSFLPAAEALGVDLDASRVGLMRGEKLHSAMSGAEESRVLLALASAQEDGKSFSVLITKDRGWDAHTLHSTMLALADSPVQIIIMSTVEPEPVEGWTMVNL